MDSVPFAFCDAVASTFQEIPQLDANLIAPWKSAFADHNTNRMKLSLLVSFEGGKWSCKASKAPGCTHVYDYVSCDPGEVQGTCRKYIYLQRLIFDNNNWGSEISLNEIKSILKFVRPCVGPSASLMLHETRAPKEATNALLSLFSSAPFNRICLFGYEEAFEGLLREQIELESLKDFFVDEDCHPRATIELEAEFMRIQSTRSG